MENKIIKGKLLGQLLEIEARENKVDNFTEWAILQNAKATILAALANYDSLKL